MSVVIASHWSPCKVRSELKLMSIPVAGSMARVILIWICALRGIKQNRRASKRNQTFSFMLTIRSYVSILSQTDWGWRQRCWALNSRVKVLRLQLKIIFMRAEVNVKVLLVCLPKTHPSDTARYNKWSIRFSNAPARLPFCLFRVIDKRAVSQRIKLELTPLTRMRPPQRMFMFSRANKHFTESSFVMQMVARYGN